MAKLILKEFRCVAETSEVSPSDSPYFLVYVGDVNAQASDVRLVRREEWDDEVDAGELRQPNITVVDDMSLDLVLVALLEEDWDTDFTGSTLGSLRNWMHNLDGLLTDPLINVPGSSVPGLIKQEFKRALDALSSNDDLLGIRRLNTSPINNNGDLELLKFTGGGGFYRVRFRHA